MMPLADAAPDRFTRSVRTSRIDAIDPSTGACMSVVRAPGAAWDQLHAELTDSGIILPIESYSDFPIESLHHRVLIGVAAPAGRFIWGGVADVGRSRIVPWRTIVRVHRVGRVVPTDVLDAVVASFSFVGGVENALRIRVELSDPDSDARRGIAEALRSRSYRAAANPRQYHRTVLIDLTPPESEILASFHHTCRRHIRGFAKHPLRCEAVTDQRFAPRLRALDAETMRRTAGSLDSFPWPEMLRFVTDHPTQAALFGVTRTDVTGADALLGYVLGVRHGDTVEYRRAASTRRSGLHAPLLYAPTWQLMRWGKEVGARWFDFGGITSGSHSSGEATGGISDFKRYFSNETTEIGSELTHSPSVNLDALASAIAVGVVVLLRVLRRR